MTTSDHGLTSHTDLVRLAAGRAAEVFIIDDHRVLRRYREPFDTLREAATMQRAGEYDFPVPRVHEVTSTDMVLDRLQGPTMLDVVLDDPATVDLHARTLAQLHKRLAEIPAPDWLPAPTGTGTQLVHFDLHPGNVMITPTGPVVIDWTNAGRGPAGTDPAVVWLLSRVISLDELATSGARVESTVRAFADAFLDWFDSDEIREHLPAVGELRLKDPNLKPAEHAAIRRTLEKFGESAPNSGE